MIDKIFADFNNTLCHLESFSHAKEHKDVICIVSEPNWISYKVYRFSRANFTVRLTSRIYSYKCHWKRFYGIKRKVVRS